MVVSIFKAGLKCIMINISDALFRLYTRNADSLEFKIRHRTGSVLSKSLVDLEADLTADGHFAAEKMRFDDFLSNSIAHFSFLLKLITGAGFFYKYTPYIIS